MSPKLIITAVVALLVIGSGGYLAATQNEEPETAAAPSSQPSAAPTASVDPTNPPQAKVASAGQYLEYQDGIPADATGQRVLFFHAPWCSQCRSIEKGIKADGVPNGLSIVKVDYDSNQDLRKKYRITQQTSFVKVDAQGNASGSPYVAYDEPTFDAVKRNYLN